MGGRSGIWAGAVGVWFALGLIAGEDADLGSDGTILGWLFWIIVIAFVLVEGEALIRRMRKKKSEQESDQ